MFPPKQPLDAGLSGPQPIPPMPSACAPAIIASQSQFSDAKLLDIFNRMKKESFDQRWVFERQWQRNCWYMLNRHWIYFDSKKGGWQDKRLAKWIPRPVTNYLKDGVQAVRANFAGINYGTNARPLGEDNANVITAGVADDYAPILHDEHRMDAVLNEFDYWMLVTGNAWVHTCVDHDRKNGVVEVPHETCVSCAQDFPQNAIADAMQKCPNCGGSSFMPTMDQAGMPVIDKQPLPKGTTMALSPFEITFPFMYESFEATPHCTRLRWRDKYYYEQTEGLETYAKTINFAKSPQERTMQLFKALPFQNDMGINGLAPSSSGASSEGEGIVEYDVWIKPCADFPEGQVIRVAGEQSPVIIHSEKENLPGPLPYHDGKGNPLFTFHHARYESVGGRALGSALIDPAIEKQNQINQIDSHMLMIMGRMANPIWLEPKGAEVEKFTGEPGLVVKWNPLIAAGNAKPERIPGEGINQSVFMLRELYKAELEELLGTNDLLKGQKPAGVEAYAAMDLLVQQGQRKHTSAYKERGAVYKAWFKDALEIEREFGPDERVRSVLQPTREWAFETFKKADLSGSVDIIIEDGTLTPKTLLGERAAIEHLRSLGLLNPSDSDQVMAIYQKFGQARLLPGLDAQVQEAWRNMDRLEKFLKGDPQVQSEVQKAGAVAQQMSLTTGQPPTAAGPLQFKRWYTPAVHRQELIKWCLSDRGRAIFQQFPSAEAYVESYLMQIDLAGAQAAMGQIDAGGVQVSTKPAGGPPQGNPSDGNPGGAGAAMANSNRNAGGAGPSSSGAAGTSQNNTQANQPQGVTG